ncbi:hypothetical protein E2C01_086578 [Portunus trituberculatus]|uniref:Uncharacterized protein n=1 Tax=Portunus trituberculatus TaxID=210409 RepID=A0A5B7JAQ2_PORTR|nr:hypothetical protein [Portunus trituberculatus]
MRAATEDATVLQKLVESESENEEEELVGDNEPEHHVLQYWKSFSVKAAVDLIVLCWNDVTPATINHAWRNLLKGMSEDRKVQVAGEPQTVAAEVEAAALEARHIPGSGFAETTDDDILEMLQADAPSAQEMLNEDALCDEASPEENEETAGVEKKGLPMSEIKKLLQYGLQICHILEQDTLINNEGKIAAITQALFPYEMYSNTPLNEHSFNEFPV